MRRFALLLSKKKRKKLLSVKNVRKPGAGVGPFLPRLIDRHAKGHCNFRMPKTGKSAQINHLGGHGIFLSKLGKCLVKCKQAVIVVANRHVDQVNPFQLASVFLSFLVPGLLDEDAPHRLRSRRKEMAATIPICRPPDIHESQVGLMDERRRLQRLPGFFLSQLLSGQPTKFVIDERQQLVRRLFIALAGGFQKLGHFVHCEINAGDFRP